MADDVDTIALRPTIVDGERQVDDFEVIWRDLPIGRILKPPGNSHWWWACNLYGQPPIPNDRGPGIDFKDCQIRFKIAWGRIKATLTEADIAVAAQHAEELAQRQPAAEQLAEPQRQDQILENNRAAQRQRVLKAGTIDFNGGTIDCVVRNVSLTGAALEVASPVGIPDEFNLRISGDQNLHHCRVAWRTDKRIGVAFQ